MKIQTQKLGTLCVLALCLVAGCKAVYVDESVHNHPPKKSTAIFEPTNTTPKIKVPLDVQIEAKSRNEVRLPVSVTVEPVSNAPLKVGVTVTNDASSPLVVPVTLRTDSRGIPINCTMPGKDKLEIWVGVITEVVKIILVGIIGYLIWFRQKRIEFTVAYLEKYHSEEIFTARNRAWKFLNDKPDTNMDEAEGAPLPNKDEDSASIYDVSKMLHYFNRLAAMGYALIDKNRACNIMGYNFYHWNERFKVLDKTVRKNKNSDWIKLFDDIKSAESWLTPKELRKGKKANWLVVQNE